MYCKNCGNSIDDATVVCPNCGVQVGELKTAENTGQVDGEKAKSSNVVGMVGFILAMVGALFWLIGLFAGILFIVAIIIAIASIVCSAIGMKKAKATNAQYRGLSIAGLVVSIVTVSISLIRFIIGLAALSVLL